MRRLCINGVLWLLLATVSYGSQAELTRPMLRVETRLAPDPLFEVAVARGEFPDSIEDLRNALPVEKARRKAAKRVEQNVEVFLKYLRAVSHDRPDFEPAELRKLTKAQLGTEILTLAQRVRPQLTRMLQAEHRAVLSVEHWTFLYQLEKDLLCLKWITGQLKS